MPTYKTFDVPVSGGTLRAGMWGTRGPVLLCSHGITANHMTFAQLVDQLGDDGIRVLAPDHRGRGRSRAIAGPWGMREHAQDLVALLDHVGVERADVVLGQSMGGFVSAVAAAEQPARFGPVLMVDGGLPIMDRLPWYLPLPLFIRLALGPAMKRLDMTFKSRAAYHAYWRAHPSLATDWSEYLERYIDYDLVGEAPALRSSTSKAAVIGDTRSMLVGDLLPRSLRALRGPVRFLRAPRGIMNGKPLYTDRHLETWGARIAGFSSETIPDVNHYTILMSAHGARAVAAEVRRLLP